MRPILEYASPVWGPHGIVVQEEFEKVQNRAARLCSAVRPNIKLQQCFLCQIVTILLLRIFNVDFLGFMDVDGSLFTAVMGYPPIFTKFHFFKIIVQIQTAINP